MAVSDTPVRYQRKAEVDVKKTDYTVQNWEDENELKEDLRNNRQDPEAIIDDLESYNSAIKPIVHILGRSAGGSKVHLRVHGVRPYFYVPKSEFDEEIEDENEVTGIEKGHENQHGESLVKIFTRIPGDVPSLRDDYTHHEADILFPNRFLIDAGIEGSIKVPEHHIGEEPTDIHIDQIEDANYQETTRVCYCDIEVDDSKGFPEEDKAHREVLSITVYDNYTEEYQIFLYHPDAPTITHEKAKVRVFLNEVDMLKAFSQYVTHRGFDAIAGWNFDDFDSRYLVNRFDYLSDKYEEADINKDDMSYLGSSYDDGWFGAKIKGMSVFDLLKAYKNLKFSEPDSYSLEDVAQEELGTGKIQRDGDVYGLWENDLETLIEYNVKDVELTVLLDDDQGIIPFYEEIANYVGGRLAECIDPSKAVDIKILRAVNDEFAVPSGENVEGESFEGAEVFDPITGVKENVVVLDLASLYPMSMKTINAGPKTKDPDGDITAPNGVSFSNEDEAIVVEIIDEMLEERQKYKDLRDEQPVDSKQFKIYDRKQAAIKVVMNTLYGVMGWTKFRLYDEDVGAAVTAVGREVIKFTEKVVEDLGYEVTYGDTDSVMIELGPDVTREEAKEIGFKLEEEINERYDEFAKEELNVDEHWFDIEFEKLYRRYFQAGKKKRYAGHIVWKEGKEKDDIDTVGFETERSDYSKIAKETLEKTLGIIVRGGGLDEVSEWVRGNIELMRSGKVDPDKYGIPASVSKAYEQYDSPTTAARAMKWVNENLDGNVQPGDKPKKMYVKRWSKELERDDSVSPYPTTGDGVGFVCWMNWNTVKDKFEWDWDKYIDNQIKKPVERVLEGTDWTWAEVITGDRQPKLGEYEFNDNSGGDDDSVVQISGDDGEEDDSSPFDEEDMDSWEREEMEARKEMLNTQEMLDGFDDIETAQEEIITATINSDDTEVTGLDEFEPASDGDEEITEISMNSDDDGQPNLDSFLN